MSDLRQMPLFAAQPADEDDLNVHTRLIDALPLFQKYLALQGRTAHTLAAFTADMALLAEYHGEGERIGRFTTQKLNEFLSWMEHRRGVPCSRKTYARRVTTLKVFFKWLKEIGAIAHDPAEAVLQRSGPAPLADILTDDQVEAVLAAGWHARRADKPDARPEMLFRLILSTGIKKSEAIALTPDDIQRDDPDAPMVYIRHAGAKDRYRERLIPLDPAIFPALDEYIAQYAPKTTLFTCTARNLEYVLEGLGRQAGSPHKISFEMLRWMFGVRAYAAGHDPHTIRQWLGLSEISWVETFAKIKLLWEKSRPARV
jgi:integrase/recombinase XerD